MNHIERMFMESNDRMRRIIRGEFDRERITAEQREFEGQIKLVRAVVDAFGFAAKYQREIDMLVQMDIIKDLKRIS
jgi:hypothetical protein